MSGLYLIVWDELDLLKTPTKGGWPHITIGYSGRKLSEDILKGEAKWLFDRHALKTINITGARVNSFRPSGADKYRHDVLLTVADERGVLEASRDSLRLRNAKDTYHMVDLHVTYKICETREEAERICGELSDRFPHSATITGVSID